MPNSSKGICSVKASYHSGIESLPTLQPKTKQPLNLVGDVSGRVAIIVDDMIDELDQFCRAAELLHEKGAKKVSYFELYTVQEVCQSDHRFIHDLFRAWVIIAFLLLLGHF
ncbi:unnamed protein product [Protopolystoma xenopodis]|uniref:Phosphoribosyltransferase domain-containing protein n=1 Tax=Protopolystoma xenopodis TaxID=117903 RepID=A0A3S5B4Z5_9PLAT|nr:unnamed protein product [Protopolystoma xenopodis]